MRIDSVLIGIAAVVTSVGLTLAIGFVCLADFDTMSVSVSMRGLLLFAAACSLVCAPCCCIGGLTVCVWTGLMGRKLSLFRGWWECVSVILVHLTSCHCRSSLRPSRVMIISLERARQLQPCSPHVVLDAWLASSPERAKIRCVFRDERGVAHVVEAWRSGAAVSLRKYAGTEFVLCCDAALRIVACAGSVAAVTGYEKQLLLGRNAHDLLAAQPSRGEIPAMLAAPAFKASLVCMRHASGAVVPLVKQLHALPDGGCEAVFLNVGELHASVRVDLNSGRMEWANAAFALLVGKDVLGAALSSVMTVDSVVGWDFHEERIVQVLPAQIPPFNAVLRRGHDSNCFTIRRVVQMAALLESEEERFPLMRCGLLFESKLHVGGWSRVYRGRLGAHACAIKAIDKRALREADCLKLLDSEVRIHRSCQCYFVVQVFEVRETLDETYVAMELMSISLNFMCIMEDGVVERVAVPLLSNLLAALEYLHGRYIVHLDVKLENVLLSREEPKVAKLCDFGVAVEKTAETFDVADLTEVAGTPLYAAPEMFALVTEFRGWGCDVWSFGVCVALFLSGQLWFDAVSEVQHGTLPEALGRGEKLSSKAKQVVTECLRLREEDRPRCAQVRALQFFATHAVD